MPDGTWRCVFQVNDYANQFAVAYSTDLVKWQPQDYPYMEGVNSCIAPVLSYDVATAAYKVLFKTKDGGVYETVSKDFYHFSKPRKVDASVYPSVTEQALSGRTAGEGTGIQSAVRRSGAHGAGCGECSILGRTQRRIGAGQ